MLPVRDFTHFLEKNKLLSSKEKVLLAVSGGKDSVLMAHLFHACNFPFAIAHCNFQLRGVESDRDETFVKQLAHRLKVDFYQQSFDTTTFAEQHQISTQLAARELRYHWFAELCEKYQFPKVATAHHQNDVSETVIFNLARGSGLSGLHGILAQNHQIIRPLLFLNRNEIDEIVQHEKIDFVEDSSNISDKYRRNQIRHQIIPALEKINPAAVHHISKTASLIVQYELIIKQFLHEHKNVWLIKTSEHVSHLFFNEVLKLEYAQVLIFELIKDFGFSGPQCEDLLTKHQSGKQFFSHTHQLTIDREVWIIEPIGKELKIDKELTLENPQIQFLNRKISIFLSENVCISSKKNSLHLDAAQIKFPLWVRTWQKGDKIKPLGMKGLKKISDIFINAKIPLTEKNKIPLVINADGRIICIAGKMIHEDFKVGINTKKILILELH